MADSNFDVWQTVRYGLIGIGSFFAGRGTINVPIDQVPAMADQIISIASGAVALVGAAWGFYVKWGTKSVPAPIAAKPSVPVVSSATGAVIK